MADLPQYPLPNQNIQSIGQTASNVPPNVLSGVGPGIAQGFGMGLQQRQVQALEQERQTQLMAAQNAAIQAKRENDLKALDTVGAQYERIAKTHPDTAFEYYQSTMAPLFSSVLKDHGIQADFQSDASPIHETSDSVKRIHDAVTGLADGSIDMPTFQKIMNREQSGHNVGDYLQKRIDEATKSGNTIQDFNKNKYEQGSKFIDSFNVDTKDIQKELVEGQTLDKQIDLARTNPIAYNLVPIKLARAAVGSARINTNELSAATGENDIPGRFQQISKQAAKGTITEANYKFMKQVSSMLINSDNSALETYAQLHAKQGSQINGKPMEENYQTLTGRPFQKEAPSNPADYLKSIGAKLTPANLKWAETKIWKQ